MTTVQLRKWSKEEVVNAAKKNNFHKDSAGFTSSRYTHGPGSSREWKIDISKDLPKKQYKELLHHEEGHVFSERRKLNKKLSTEQKRMLVKDYGAPLARGRSSFAKLQEVIAEVYRTRKYHSQSPQGRAFKSQNPKTTAIIDNEIKKFKIKFKRRTQ